MWFTPGSPVDSLHCSISISCQQTSLTACTLWVPHPLWPSTQTSPHNQQCSSVQDGAYMPQKACTLAHLSGISWVLLLVKFQCWYDWPWLFLILPRQLIECSCWTVLPPPTPKKTTKDKRQRTYSQLLKVLNLAVESEQGVLLLPGQGQLLTQLLCLLLVAVSGHCVRHQVQLALYQHAGDRATLWHHPQSQSHHPQSQSDVTLALTQSDVTLAITQKDVTLALTHSDVTLTKRDVTLALTQSDSDITFTQRDVTLTQSDTPLTLIYSELTLTQRYVTLTQWHPPHPHKE